MNNYCFNPEKFGFLKNGTINYIYQMYSHSSDSDLILQLVNCKNVKNEVKLYHQTDSNLYYGFINNDRFALDILQNIVNFNHLFKEYSA